MIQVTKWEGDECNQSGSLCCWIIIANFYNCCIIEVKNSTCQQKTDFFPDLRCYYSFHLKDKKEKQSFHSSPEEHPQPNFVPNFL